MLYRGKGILREIQTENFLGCKTLINRYLVRVSEFAFLMTRLRLTLNILCSRILYFKKGGDFLEHF